MILNVMSVILQEKTKIGLKRHKSIKHKSICQVDGNDDIDVEKETITDIEDDKKLMTNNKEKVKFKCRLDVSPECNIDDVRESVETNFHGALEDKKLLMRRAKRY